MRGCGRGVSLGSWMAGGQSEPLSSSQRGRCLTRRPAPSLSVGGSVEIMNVRSFSFGLFYPSLSKSGIPADQRRERHVVKTAEAAAAAITCGV